MVIDYPNSRNVAAKYGKTAAFMPKPVYGEALDALEADNEYLLKGGVFPKELIANFIKGKRAECAKMSAIPHPAEFDLYYNV